MWYSPGLDVKDACLHIACWLGQDNSLNSTESHMIKEKRRKNPWKRVFVVYSMCAQSLCVCTEGRGNSAPEWFAGMQKAAAGLLGLESSLAQHKKTRRPNQGAGRLPKATNPGLDPIPSRLVFGPSGIQSESAPPRRHQLIVLFPVLARLRLSCSLHTPRSNVNSLLSLHNIACEFAFRLDLIPLSVGLCCWEEKQEI